MNSQTTQKLSVVLVVFGAIIFGMVLAGGLSLTPQVFGNSTGFADDSQAQRIEQDANAKIASFADLAEAVLPTVGLVQSTTIEEVSDRAGTDPFDFFFRGPRGQDSDEPRQFRSDGAGSGFVISPDGWIVTNNHVIDGATEVEVVLDGTSYEAEVKGADPSTDLALIKIDAKDLKFLALGDSESVRVGDWVMAVGNPLRQLSSVSVGVISGKGRVIGLTRDTSFENFIQTDAAINQGNSGGPIVNTTGEVIGIATAMNFGAENIGFAVPVDTLKQVLPQLREEGRVRRGYLGVNIQNLDERRREAFGLTEGGGALVVDVVEGAPAEKAGLEPGDVIVRVDDHDVSETRDLIDYVSNKRPGAKVTVDVLRNGEEVEREIELEDRPDVGEATPEPPEEVESEMEWLGLQYQDLSDAARRAYGLPRQASGVVVTEVLPSSTLYEEGVRPGDVIVEVNGDDVGTVADFEQAVSDVPSGGFLRLYVVSFGRDGSRRPFFAIARVP